MITLIIHRLLSYPELKMAYNDSNIVEYKGYFEKGERSEEFNIFSKAPSQNCVLAYFPMYEYDKFKDQLENTSMPRNERIKIMRYHSESPLCSTGSFIKRRNIECRFIFRGNGSIIFFPETHNGNYIVISLLILYNKKQLCLFGVVLIYGFLLPYIVIIFIIIDKCSMINCDKHRDEFNERNESSDTSSSDCFLNDPYHNNQSCQIL